MAGRNHLPPKAIKFREVPLSGPPLIDGPSFFHRSATAPGGGSTTSWPHHPHSITLLEDRIAAQHREIQSLLLDNQRLAATHVALKQEFSLAQQELRHLSMASANVKSEGDNQMREVYEKSLKLEAEARAVDAMVAELNRVRADVEKFGVARQEAKAHLQGIEGELTRARSESQQVPAIKKEIGSMHQEIQRGRAAIEYEKKTHASNLEQSQAMEKNMIYMAHEVEKLRAELANAEKRARAAAAAAAAANPCPGYAPSYGIPDMGYGGSPYPDPYGMHQFGVANCLQIPASPESVQAENGRNLGLNEEKNVGLTIWRLLGGGFAVGRFSWGMKEGVIDNVTRTQIFGPELSSIAVVEVTILSAFEILRLEL